MAQNVSDVRPITTSEAVTWRKGGKFGTTANQAGYSGAGGRVDGVFSRDAASGDGTGLRLLNAGGTFVITMVTSCSVGDLLYAAASGKFSTVALGAPVFVALQVATTDGDEIEAVAVGNGNSQGTARTVEAHTAGDTLTNSESGSVHTNVGASGTITIALPAAIVGIEFFFAVGAAQELRIDPNGTETISLPSSGVPGAAGKYLVADAIGETVHLMCCSAGSWRVMGYTGTWTAEA